VISGLMGFGVVTTLTGPINNNAVQLVISVHIRTPMPIAFIVMGICGYSRHRKDRGYNEINSVFHGSPHQLFRLMSTLAGEE
jgi:hypothetical protein